jgi:hypothetical protein
LRAERRGPSSTRAKSLAEDGRNDERPYKCTRGRQKSDRPLARFFASSARGARVVTDFGSVSASQRP